MRETQPLNVKYFCCSQVEHPVSLDGILKCNTVGNMYTIYISTTGMGNCFYYLLVFIHATHSICISSTRIHPFLFLFLISLYFFLLLDHSALLLLSFSRKGL